MNSREESFLLAAVFVRGSHSVKAVFGAKSNRVTRPVCYILSAVSSAGLCEKAVGADDHGRTTRRCFPDACELMTL